MKAYPSERAENRPFATHRFGNQERLGVRMIESRRMELHEFHVGYIGAGPPADRNSISGRNVGVAGVQVDLAGSTGRQHGELGAEGHHFPVLLVKDIGSEAAVGSHFLVECLGLGDQVDSDMVLVKGDVRMFECSLDQRSFDFPAGGILGMQDPAVTVPAFAGQVVLLIGVPTEFDTPVDQVFNSFRTGFRQPA